MEDKTNMSNNDDNNNGEEVSRLDRLKSFAYRHRKKIIAGAVLTASTVVAVVYFKAPDNREKAKQLIEDVFGDRDVKLIDIDTLSDNGLDELIEATAEVVPEPEPPALVDPLSARRLGDMIGKSAQWVNKRLCELGYLEGTPGNWTVTEKGKAVSRMNAYDNGIRGYYHIGNPYAEWDRNIIYELGDPDECQAKIERIRAETRRKFGEVV